MIKSFRDRRTAVLFQGNVAKGIAKSLAKAAAKKLRLLHTARNLADLANLPGNRLEALKEDRAGQHSIRINNQWRICFRWQRGAAEDVEFCDYHQRRTNHEHQPRRS